MGKGGDERRALVKPAATWSASIQKVFLDNLAESANVTKSALAAGTSDKRAWQRRQADAKFRAAFLRALSDGYLRLELLMLQHALVRASGGTDAAENPLSFSEVRMNVQLLRQHRNAVQTTDIFEEIEDLAVVKQRIAEKLAEMRRRLSAPGAE